ncbi:MAG: hypothetical protein PW734_06800 [Verrucomicrobium sp.]|nr:hypothetical protein [Verrucomicrobium sp.]
MIYDETFKDPAPPTRCISRLEEARELARDPYVQQKLHEARVAGAEERLKAGYNNEQEDEE